VINDDMEEHIALDTTHAHTGARTLARTHTRTHTRYRNPQFESVSQNSVCHLHN